MTNLKPIFDVHFIKALADPVRQNIILLLGEMGELTSGQVAEAFQPMTHATISHHLRILKLGGVLLSKKEGKTAVYQINRISLTGAMEKLTSMITNCCLGPECCGGEKPGKDN
jgi:DNA-binding transcriptional ArsR family regulator